MPVTVTASLKVIVTAIADPALYVPLVVGEVTFVTVGAVVSTIIALLAPSDPL